MADLGSFDVSRREIPGATRWAMIVANPTAGSGPARKHMGLETIVSRFHHHGWNVAIVPTRGPGDGTEAARHALALGADVVVAMGGDGTVNEVIQALAESEVPLGILPVGTINILAMELKLPFDPVGAVDAIAGPSAGVKRIDLGTANGRYFALMVGVGYDGEITRSVIPELKQVSGPFAYMFSVLQSFFYHKAARARITIELGGRRRRMRTLLYVAIVSNVGNYAGGSLKFTPEASFDDGLLDVCLVRSRRWYQALFHLAMSFTHYLNTVSSVRIERTTAIDISTSRPWPIQIDGDPAGSTPVRIRLHRGALSVFAGHAILTPDALKEPAV